MASRKFRLEDVPPLVIDPVINILMSRTCDLPWTVPVWIVKAVKLADVPHIWNTNGSLFGMYVIVATLVGPNMTFP